MTDYPEHPGSIIARNIDERYAVGLDEAAELLEEPPNPLYSLFTGERPVTPEIALKLAAVFNFDANTLVRMQADYDLWVARHEPDVVWKVRRLARILPADKEG